MNQKTIVWFRNDLRLHDHSALWHAAQRGEVIFLYVHPPERAGWSQGSASKWWLHHSLLAFQGNLEKAGTQLVIRAGDPLSTIEQMLKETGASAVYWNRRYEHTNIIVDRRVKEELTNKGVECKSFCGNLLYEPWSILNKSGKPFQVFTPFWKACRSAPRETQALPVPVLLKTCQYQSLTVDHLNLLPAIHWDTKFSSYWSPGEQHAQERLKQFAVKAVLDYPNQRDLPAVEGVSLLSPHLHFGEISPRAIWEHIIAHANPMQSGVECYLRQLGWREFAHHLLYHFPKTPDHPLRSDFEHFPWKKNTDQLKAWQKGMTGYPIVDAGMRQLWETGWMHNRVRMIVGSFLVKDLLISWQEGAQWFWDTLVDADLANNTLGWQWIGGCGADAAPYFRVFNPILQGEKFDPSGEYVRKWIPELKNVPQKWIHQPWNAPPIELLMAGVRLGQEYPHPIVEHEKARIEALAAFKTIRRGEENE